MEDKITDILNLIPENPDWPFKILDKTSASASLIILINVPVADSKECPRKVSGNSIPVALKVWCKARSEDNRPATLAEKCLEYEKKVYVKYIKNLLSVDPTLPFLAYLGDDNDCSTVDSLSKFIGAAGNIEAETTLCTAFYVMDSMSQYEIETSAKYQSRSFYEEYFEEYPDFTEDFVTKMDTGQIKKWKIGAVLLPMKKYKPFADIIGTDIQVEVFRQIVKGLAIISNLKLTHNDLHTKNIMVEDSQALIYDWDRAYAVGLGDNPFLDDQLCAFPCDHSQCNLYIKDRPIDLIKVLAYAANETDVLYDLLSNGLKLKNYKIDGEIFSRFYYIQQGFASTNVFLQKDGCSALYDPGSSVKLERCIDYIGGIWPVIYARAFGLDEPIRDQKYIDKANRYIRELTEKVELADTKFGFGDGPTLVASRPITIDGPKLSYILKKNIDLTWNDFVALQDARDYLRYGPPIPVKKPVLKPAAQVKAVPFYELLLKNEERKAKLRKR